MDKGPIEIVRLSGEDAIRCLPEVARLRIAVFREYPYLYDGDFEYEKNYLRTYSASTDSVIVVATDAASGEIVGAATGVPLSDADTAVRKAFLKHGYSLDEWFYYGESVLLPIYRGLGIGVRFFSERETHALALGCSQAAFCGVARPENHPQKPPGYVPLHEFWRHRGYRLMPDVECSFSWKEIGETTEKEFPMAFWGKVLRNGTPV